MPTTQPPKIDLNTADAHHLTELPGVSKTVAYRIVNHRQRHGYLTSWEELREITGFPVEKLEAIKERAELVCPDPGCVPPRHLETRHIDEIGKKTGGLTRKQRGTHGPKKFHDPAANPPH